MNYRAILTAITAIVMIVIGIFLSNIISKEAEKTKEQCENAAKIETKEEFDKAIKESAGYVFVYGNLKAAEPVTYPEIKSEYIQLKKVKEKRVEHQKIIQDKDIDGNITGCHTETYYDWETEDTELLKTEKVTLCDVAIKTSKIELPEKYITEIKESKNLRYRYYGTENNQTGTLYANLTGGTIEGTFYQNKNIGQTIELLESNADLIVFWIIWILLTIVSTFSINSIW